MITKVRLEQTVRIVKFEFDCYSTSVGVKNYKWVTKIELRVRKKLRKKVAPKHTDGN